MRFAVRPLHHALLQVEELIPHHAMRDREHASVANEGRGHNQNDEMVCTFRGRMLIPARGQAVEDRVPRYSKAMCDDRMMNQR